MVQKRLQEIRKIRLERVKKLRDMGIDPYPAKVDGKPIEIGKARGQEGEKVEIVGRIMGWRTHGNVIFADLRDETATIQLWFQKNILKENFKILKYFDIGDFLYAKGKVTKTKAGELTIDVSKFQLLAKSIRPLPSSWSGFKDVEERYRQRYVDLALNEDLKDLFRKRAIFWNSMREFMLERGFLEVETPILENTVGGADANPFVTHHDALDIDLYLRISMGELWQKRLMVAGFQKTFELGRQFRNEGISREHSQDYTQMEFYWAYANYEDSMDLVEEMYKFVAKKTFGTLKFIVRGYDVDLLKKWERIDYSKTVKKKSGIDISKASTADIKKKLGELKVVYGKGESKSRLIDLIWKHVRRQITGPAFLVGHPVEVSPLAKRIKENPDYVERYQVIIAGSELGNGYSELNDPVDQAERFKAQQKMRDEGDKEAHMHDEDFIRALEYGMPPVTGFGVSERLFSFLANKPIRETVLFPLLRPKTKTGVKPKRTIGVKQDKVRNLGSIAPEVAKKFPGISYAFVIIKDVEVKKKDEKLELLKKELVKNKSKLNLKDIESIKPIRSYRDMLKKTGVKTDSRRPSPEALLRRIIQGKGLYAINTAVDAYNLAVIETGIGLGGFDFREIEAPVILRFSKEGEAMVLLGESRSTITRKGEIVYADKNKLLTLDLNYRDIDRTKITLNTKSIMLFADGGVGINPKEVKRALKLGADYIQKFCGGRVGDIVFVN